MYIFALDRASPSASRPVDFDPIHLDRRFIAAELSSSA
jgi:hypothetical protein